jgi:uncharacterized membrane protein
MLVPIPIGLWLFSLACDLIGRFGGGGGAWTTVAFYTMVGGIVGALLAAVPGFIDVVSLPARVKKIGLTHMGLNLTVVVLYAINAWLRRDGVTDGLIWLSVISVAPSSTPPLPPPITAGNAAPLPTRPTSARSAAAPPEEISREVAAMKVM